jgi:ribosomal protein L28
MKNCEICGKTSRMVGTRILLRGHYNPTNWSRKYPNLQKTTTPKGEKVVACTNCIRTFGKAARMEKKKTAKAAAVAAKAAAPAPAPQAEAKPKKAAKKKEAK